MRKTYCSVCGKMMNEKSTKTVVNHLKYKCVLFPVSTRRGIMSPRH